MKNKWLKGLVAIVLGFATGKGNCAWDSTLGRGKNISSEFRRGFEVQAILIIFVHIIIILNR